MSDRIDRAAARIVRSVARAAEKIARIAGESDPTVVRTGEESDRGAVRIVGRIVTAAGMRGDETEINKTIIIKESKYIYVN